MSARARATETLHVVTTTQSERLTFWNIEQQHLELLEYRDLLALTQETEKTDLAQEIAVVDAEIRKFIESGIRKVTAIAGLWRMCEGMHVLSPHRNDPVLHL